MLVAKLYNRETGLVFLGLLNLNEVIVKSVEHKGGKRKLVLTSHGAVNNNKKNNKKKI